MHTLRHYFKQEQQVSKEDIYISNYWNQGASDEQHKLIKKEDASLEAMGSGKVPG